MTILALQFGPHVFGKVFFFGDDFYLLVPGKLFLVEWLKKGVLPLWNPYVLGGISWVGDITQSIWYGSTFLFLLLPPAVALSVNQALHVAIGFIGAFLLGRRWGLRQTFAVIPAVLLSMGMNVAGSFNNMAVLQSLAWVPWIMESLFQVGSSPSLKRAMRFALVTAIFLFSGYPQLLVYAVVGGAALAVFRFHLFQRLRWSQLLRFCVFSGVGLFTAVALSAVVLLPFWAALQHSTRVIQTQQQSSMGSVQPVELLKIFIPSLFDNFKEGMRWGPVQSAEPSLVMYIGWFGVFMLALRILRKPAPKDIFFACFIVAALSFSLGRFLPGFEFIQKLLPAFRFTRSPSLVMVLATLFAGLWLGGMLQEGVVAKPKILKKFGMVFLAFFIVSVAGMYLSQVHFSNIWRFVDNALHNRLSNSAFHTEVIDQVICRLVLLHILVSSGLASCACWLIAQKQTRWFMVILLADLWFASRMLCVYAPASMYDFHPNEQMTKTLLQDQGRVLTSNYNTPYADFGAYYMSVATRKPFTDSSIDHAELSSFSTAKRMQKYLTSNWESLAHVRNLHGYVTLLPQSANAFWNPADTPRINSLPHFSLNDPRLREWSVNYYLADTWFPNVVIPHSAPVLEGDVAKGETWKLYKLDALPRFRYEDGSPVAMDAFWENPNTISFRTVIPVGKQRITVADRWEQGWTVHVDGKTIDVRSTSAGLREFSLSPGVHEIQLRYSPREFLAGAGISLTAWIVLLASWGYSRFRRKQN